MLLTTFTSGSFKYTMHRKHVADYFHLRPLLQTGMEFNPIMDLWDWDEIIFPLTNFNGFIIRMWERLSSFIIHLYWTYDYLSVLRFQLKCVSKTD